MTDGCGAVCRSYVSLFLHGILPGLAGQAGTCSSGAAGVPPAAYLPSLDDGSVFALRNAPLIIVYVRFKVLSLVMKSALLQLCDEIKYLNGTTSGIVQMFVIHLKALLQSLEDL